MPEYRGTLRFCVENALLTGAGRATSIRDDFGVQSLSGLNKVQEAGAVKRIM